MGGFDFYPGIISARIYVCKNQIPGMAVFGSSVAWIGRSILQKYSHNVEKLQL